MQKSSVQLGFKPNKDVSEIVAAAEAFLKRFEPLESQGVFLLKDEKTGAIYLECHVLASKICELGNKDAALDPEESADYRANREPVEDHAAYERMVSDAEDGRVFSNIVCEFQPDDAKPLQIIGGQHRFMAIEKGLAKGKDVHHGIKVYLQLTKEQRLDVQVISNTNIQVSPDLLDRMFETVSGAELRTWCQSVGLLAEKEDFADQRKRGSAITVREARTFIINYFRGKEVPDQQFAKVGTTPFLIKAGDLVAPEWRDIKDKYKDWNTDKGLATAGKEYARLIDEQQTSVEEGKAGKISADYAEKAKSFAVLSAWVFVAGVLHKNNVRLQRHYDLAKPGKGDPLAAAVLAKGRHGSDPDNYRGLGYRTDPKERGRFVELFWLQAEKGGGITKKLVDAAIAEYHAKEAMLEAERKKKDL
jgi:hypothetical protein